MMYFHGTARHNDRDLIRRVSFSFVYLITAVNSSEFRNDDLSGEIDAEILPKDFEVFVPCVVREHQITLQTDNANTEMYQGENSVT